MFASRYWISNLNLVGLKLITQIRRHFLDIFITLWFMILTSQHCAKTSLHKFKLWVVFVIGCLSFDQSYATMTKCINPVGTQRKMNVFCAFKIGSFVPRRKKGRFLDILKIIFVITWVVFNCNLNSSGRMLATYSQINILISWY